jgi:tight adherence protein B
MSILSLHPSLLVGIASLLGALGGALLLRAISARERITTRAEEQAADPATLSDPLRRKSILARWADRYDRSARAQAVQERLRKAYVSWKPSEYAIIRIALSAGTAYIALILFGLPLFFSVGLGLITYYLAPALFFFVRRDAYLNALNQQLVEISRVMANALRAGMSVQQALGQVAERLPEPARGEFRQTHSELLLGKPFEQALWDLQRRVGSRDLRVAMSAVIVQYEAGGNLARVLHNMADVLTERQRLASEIRSLTADARVSATVVMIMPIIMLLLIKNTPLGDGVFVQPLGWLLLAVFGAIQIGTYMLVQRIARIEV